MSCPFRAGLVLMSAIVFSSTLETAQKAGQNATIQTQAPTIETLSGVGMQRGTALEVIIGGSNLASPVGVSTSFPAKITIPDDNGNGQDATKLRVLIEVPADAPIGFHSVRLATRRGISNQHLFCIDELPQPQEATGNREKSTPQEVRLPCVVTGRLIVNKSSWFQFQANSGDVLSFDVLGRRLGSPIDPEITLYDAKTQRELAYDNDSPGCQSDPRLRFAFKNAGTYLIEVKDVLSRGGPDYQFRLRIGDFPLATVPMPLAIQRGQTATIRFAGPAVENSIPVEMKGPARPETDVLWVTPRSASGLAGWPVPLQVTDLPEVLESGTNLQADKAVRMHPPAGISARFVKRDETHFFRFFAQKGKRFLIEAQSLELGSPSLVYMVLRNSKSQAEIVRSKPETSPPGDQVIDFTAQEEGEYLLAVQHLNYLGGPSEAFRLAITPSRPSFELTTGSDRFDLAPGGFTVVPVQAQRNGWTGPIDLTVSASDGLSGKGVIAAGKNSAALVLRAEAGIPLGGRDLMIKGEAGSGAGRIVRFASARTAVVQSLANLPLPPRDLLTRIAAGIRESGPFRLSASIDRTALLPGMTAQLLISVRREPGFDGEINLALPTTLPSEVTLSKTIVIPKGNDEIKVPLSASPKASNAELIIYLSGTARHNKQTFTEVSLPVELSIVSQPFDLELTPTQIALSPGKSATLAIKVIRKTVYDGPITLEVRNLPAGISAGTATIARGQQQAELTLTAAATAMAAAKIEAQIVGVASGLPGAPNVTATASVSVEKK